MDWQPIEARGTLPTQKEEMSSSQVRNRGGGFVWKVDDMVRFQRFLCLGTEHGTFYTTEEKLTRENAACIDRMLQEGRGIELVEKIKLFSADGRCVKQKPVNFALALCARSNDPKTKQAAYNSLSDVCRVPTQMFEFIEFCQTLSSGTGWGRAHRRAVCKWYNNYKSDPMQLALHVTKYRSRYQWSHQDLLRLAHIKPVAVSEPLAFIYRYIAKGLEDARKFYKRSIEQSSSILDPVVAFLAAVEEAHHCNDESRMAELIRGHGLVREHVPTQLLSSVPIWQALLNDMPITALIRNLGKMTSIGLLTPGGDNESLVVSKLGNLDLLKKGRVHPFSVLLALKTYEKGHGDKGSLKWIPSSSIVQALDGTFNLTFNTVEPTHKRYLLAVNVGCSMDFPIIGASSITARDAAAAMMMTVARTEQHFKVVAFSHDLIPLDICATHSLNVVITNMRSLPSGATDCSQPLLYAVEKKELVDVFIVFTDSETFYGKVHPAEALLQYRKASRISDSRLIVVGMTSDGFTIADPDDPGMLDVVGFDYAAPEAMRRFIEGDMDIAD